MITRVRVKNFRSLADVDVTLGPLTVLVGRNGAGKSAFVDALCFMRDALRSGIDEALRKRNGLAMLQTRHADGIIREMTFEVTVQLDDFSAEYGFALAPAEQGAYSIAREYLRLLSGDTPETVFDIENGLMKIFPEFNTFSEQNIPNAEETKGKGNQLRPPTPVIYHFYDPARLIVPTLSARLAQASDVVRQITNSYFYGAFSLANLRQPQLYYHDPVLFEDGTNLAALLKAKQTKGVLDVIKAALRGAVPDIQDLGIDDVGGYLVIKTRHKESDKVGGEEWFNLSQESDGTIHFLTILSALYQSLSPGFSRFALIAVEEPETALYPAVLSVLGDVIKEASCRSQILITTQSPDFISEFRPDTLRVVEKVDGATHIGPLDELQAGIIHDKLFTTGDLLRIEGLRSLPAQPVSAEDA